MYSVDEVGLYDTCDGTLGWPEIPNCCGESCAISWASWVGSEGTVLHGVSVVRTSRGGSAEDEIEETSDSETLPTEAAGSGRAVTEEM